jgi:hypothetical protein
LVASFEQTPRNCDKRSSRFRRLDAVVASFSVKTELKSLLELQGLFAEIGRSGVKMIRSGAETLLFQNLKQISKMTELSEVVHAEALRVTLNLKGTNAGHYICPILQLHLTVAQGNQEPK